MKQKKPLFNIVDQLGALRRYARSLARDSNDAEDLVHDALVKALERKASFRSDGNLRSWLLSIVHNEFIDGLRRARASQKRSDDAGLLSDSSEAASQPSAVRLKQVQAAFFRLPDEQREALHLVAVEELTYQEAAQVLGIPVGTLMSRVSRARAQLRAFEDGKPGSQSNTSHTNLRLIGGKGDDGY
ncbi:sigma-70 family RNA polymerase sigma factor [Rhizobium sp. CFBP 8762]|uniref:sigma-70 family RNA polymerase sigma factor n=1 Tax=Rhizobium sp. CFBP 8762 TaxID=2775279 RepID=UPI00178432EE|nr:sigma-70 family RNA polymerase sigma factor [Rhizobium sp. CFBP 8762]MBD8553953.1 sigma-70 family RNA polymerase sigma factor [Rhizobium sp. CFBP 8762]